ncbi:MAG: L-serine ammonia-lyase, iron-sulfur-dependent, subunit alpha [Candidatus Hodarchaeales archaeon]|jgi:L-serine dehydratase
MTVNNYPSIFNDVLGPIMRGPSSSHCAASVRIGRMARDLMDGNIQEVLIEFDPNGSLATTHDSQGSDMGLCAGFLGWEADDERLTTYNEAIADAGINIKLIINDIKAEHPNTYKLTLKNEEETHELIAISTGGGMIEITEIDRMKVSILGDYYETLIYTKESTVLKYLQNLCVNDEIISFKDKDTRLIEVKGQNFLSKEILDDILSKFNILEIKEICPVLPILSRKDMNVPFTTCEEMLRYNEKKNWDLWNLATHYESIRGNISSEEVFNKMKHLIKIMKTSIEAGLKGTDYTDRILGFQSGDYKAQLENRNLLDGGILNQIIIYITAMMEIKSSMGVIIAAPTAGACGTIPGTILGASSVMNLSEDEIIRAMLAAGMIGIFISNGSTFSAEIGGCQAECGSASGMATAGLVTLKNGTTKQAIDAASMALQNSLGMVCDPVANRVEVPCLGKNVMAASNALACANMALANYDVVVPLGEVIEAMDQVGKSIAYELRCTALGGLSITDASRKLEEKLRSLKHT